MPEETHLIHIRKPRDAFEKPFGETGILSNVETEIPNVVGGTLFLRRERREPSACAVRSEDCGMEEVPLALSNPSFGYESACSEGLRV